MANIDLKAATALTSKNTVVNVLIEYSDGGTMTIGKATIAAVLAGLTLSLIHI